MILEVLFNSFWLLLPASFANVLPPIATKIFPNFLNYPLDFRFVFKGKRLLGDHKTFRGLLVGGLGAVFICVFLKDVQEKYFSELLVFFYPSNPYLFGFLSALGALGGDALKSFFKRRLNIPSGVSWFPFDQLDWIVGTLLVLLFFFNLTWIYILGMFILGISLHLLFRFAGFVLGIVKENI